MKKSTKQWKKVLAALALAVMTPLLASVVAFAPESMALTAQAAVTSGNFKTADKNGNALAWSYDDKTLTLTISGKGTWGDGIEAETGITLLGLKRIVFSEGCAVSGSMAWAFAGSYNADTYTYDSTLEEIDLSKLDTSQVTRMDGMFSDCSGLSSLDLSGFDTSQVTDMSFMFYDCDGLTSLDLSDFDTSQVTDMRAMFYYCKGLTSLDLSSFDTSKVTDMSFMFYICDGLSSLDLSGFDTSQVTNMRSMFRSCNSLTSLDLSGFDTSQVMDMSYMFFNCSALTSLDISSFDTSQVMDMNDMFYNCWRLSSLDVSKFNTTNVTDMSYMFLQCSGLTSLDVSRFDTSRVMNMTMMFSSCWHLTSLNVSGFDTRQVTNMSEMFTDCLNLTSLDVSRFDTSQVTNMSGMFSGCDGLTSLDVGGFDTGKVTNMSEMFDGCYSLTSLNMSGLDMSQVTDMDKMFQGCSVLNSIYTPKALRKGASISLPDVFCSPTGAETESITTEFLSTVLTRKKVTPAPTETPTAPDPTQTPASPTPTQTPVSSETETQVRNFATRMYTKALGRGADEAGLNDWTNRLLTHEIDGAGIAFGFIMSPEFGDRDLSDNDYVETLYQTFFNRNSDEGGKATWMGELAAGKPRSSVLAGFVNSQEFDNLCESFGIVRGIMREDGSVVNPGIRQFVERCYTKVLGRAGEKEGLENWTNAILQGAQTPEEVAKNFFFSQEYTDKNTADDVFVETLYQTFMDRDSDSQGKQNWLDALAGGTSRAEVLEGFSRSEEFGKILEGFGL